MDSPTINFIWKLVDLMLGRIIVPKYLDLGRLVIGVHITEILDQNTLIFTGDVINIVTKNAMLNSIFKIP